jgi:hypothetical protein
MSKKIFSNLRLFFIPCQENNYRPRFLMNKWLLWVIIALFIAKIVVISFFIYLPKTTFFSDLLAALTKSSIVELTNQERKSLGLAPLKVNPKLEEAAYLKAQDMMAKDYFSHQSPAGVRPWDWLKKVNYKYKYAGENLAIGFLDSDEVIKAWNESPSHRANLLNSNYQEIGIAVVRGNFEGSETTLVVQFFGSPVQQKVVVPKAAVETTKPTEGKATETKPQEEKITPPQTEVLPEETKVEPKEEVILPNLTDNENTAPFRLFQFAAENYPGIVQNVIFYFLILVIIALILNVFIRIDIQDRSLILRTVIFILLLTLLSFINKGILVKFIPHSPLI